MAWRLQNMATWPPQNIYFVYIYIQNKLAQQAENESVTHVWRFVL